MVKMEMREAGHKIQESVFIWNSSPPDGSIITPVRWMEEEVGGDGREEECAREQLPL